MSLCRRLAPFLFTALAAGAAHAGDFAAGAGRADIAIPPSVFPIDGFVAQHDPLAARILLMKDNAHSLVIVSVDQTSIFEGSIDDIKAIVGQIAHVAPDNIVVCASHGFSAPHVFPPDNTPDDLKAKTTALKLAIDTAVRDAAIAALADLQPAKLGFGEGVSRVAVNRDVATPFGWWLGGDDAGYSDPTLGMLRIDATDGKPLAVVMDYGVQSSVLDFSIDSQGRRLVSSDLAGMATRAVETTYPGATSLFLVGAAADQAPYLQANRHVVKPNGTATRIDIHDAGLDLLTLLGERLGQDALSTVDAIRPDKTPSLQIVREKVEVTTQTGVTVGPPPKGPLKSVDFQTAAPVEVPIILMRIGDVAIVAVREELSARTGTWIRKHSPFAHTLVVTMADGAAKYMPEADAYDRITYEARSSHYAKGSAEILARAVVERLSRMKAEPGA